MLFAAALGYFMIYGLVSDIYLSVITLVVTLILEKGIRSTSGPEYVIGDVRLNGQNGIPGLPSLRLPWDPSAELFVDGVLYLSILLLVLVYVGLRLLLVTHFGRVLVGIRENERRIDLLGYDSRRYKLAAFVLAAGIAALSGVLYAVWGNFVAPEMFNLNQAAQVVIWVIVGGKSTLIGPIVGTALVQHLTLRLGTIGVGQVTLVLGIVLMGFVLVFREGLVPSLGLLLGRLLGRGRGGATAESGSERSDPRDQSPGEALRRRARDRRGRLRPRARRAALPDRPQRRRQEHLLQAPDRPDRALRGRDPVRGRRHHGGGAAPDRPARHRHQEPGPGRLQRAQRGARTSISPRAPLTPGARPRRARGSSRCGSASSGCWMRRSRRSPTASASGSRSRW